MSHFPQETWNGSMKWSFLSFHRQPFGRRSSQVSQFQAGRCVCQFTRSICCEVNVPTAVVTPRKEPISFIRLHSKGSEALAIAFDAGEHKEMAYGEVGLGGGAVPGLRRPSVWCACRPWSASQRARKRHRPRRRSSRPCCEGLEMAFICWF